MQGYGRRALLARSMGIAGAATLLGGLANAAAQTSVSEKTLGSDFVIRAGWALTEREGALELVRDAWLRVRDGKIAAVSSKPIKDTAPLLELPDDLLLPGFISGHTHCCSATPTRGIIEGPRSYQRPLELVEALSDAELDALTALNLAELIRSGCTTQVEMALSLRQAGSYVRAAERFGARGYPGAMIPDIARLFPIWFRADDRVLMESEPGTLAEIQRNLEFGRRHMGAGKGRILPMMSPHACDTHTPATLAAVAAAATELGTGLHIHLSQSRRETETVKRLWNRTPTQWLESLGFFAGPVFGAHMVGLDWSTDAPILAKYGVVYAHCPSAGGAGGATQPYPEALAAGIQVNVAIDTHSNDYLENLKLAVLLGQARHALVQELGKGAQPTVSPTIWDAVDGATRVPARALGREDLGVIRPGATADLVSVAITGLMTGTGALPPEPLNLLLYASGRNVRTVMIEGELKVRGGEFIAGDTRQLLADGGAVVEKIWAQLDAEGWFTETPRLTQG